MTESVPKLRIEDLLAQATWVFRLVRSMVRDADFADDVVQDTMLRAIEQAPRARDELALRSWLSTVARRLALRRLGSEAARRRREALVATTEVVDPAAIERRVVLQRMLAAEVLNLDETTRTAVILRYQDGLSAKAIAQRLGITHAAARQRIARGIARLRQRLEQQHGKGRTGWVAVFAPLLRSPSPLLRSVPGRSMRQLWIAGATISLAAAVTWIHQRAAEQPTISSLAQDTTSPPTGTKSAPATTADRTADILVPTPVPGMQAGLDRDRDLHGRVVDAAGRPVVGAEIEALRLDEAAYLVAAAVPAVSRLPAAASPILRTQSDALGEFAMRLERDAVVDLHVRAAGYGVELRPYLRAGERVEVGLAAAGDLIGRIVRAADGQPAAGVPVRFVRWWFQDGIARELSRTVSGTDGEFALGSLPPCRLAIEVAAPGEACQPTVVEIEAGGTTRTVIGLGGGRVVHGRVRDADSGQPIAEAVVVGSYAHLLPGGGAQRDPSALAVANAWAPAAEDRSDAAGHFAVAVPTDFAPVQVHLAAPGYATSAVLLPADGKGELDLLLRRGHAIDGRVVDTEGRPLAGARVAAAAVVVVGSVEHSDWCQANTDAAGQFSLTDLRNEMQYHVAIRHPGFAPRIVEVARASGRAAIALGDLALDPPAVVRGIVTGLDGSIRPGIFVTVETDAGDVLARVRTDDLGRFAATGMPAGHLSLCAGRAREPIDLSAGEVREGVRIALAGDTVFGTVTDLLGAPIHNALVLLVDTGNAAPPRHFVSGTDGRFTFGVVPPGRYSLRAAPNSIHLDGGDRMVHQVQMDGVAPGPVELRVVLPPADALRGTVVDADGAPLGQTIVFARFRGGELATYEMSAKDGTFVLRLPHGAVVDLAVGQEAPRQIVARGVEAGATGVRLVRGQTPK